MTDDKKKLRPDANELAHRAMLEATGQAERTPPPGERTDEQKHPEAVKRGSKGGRRGGYARASKLSQEERSKMAKKAALSRWKDRD